MEAASCSVPAPTAEERAPGGHAVTPLGEVSGLFGLGEPAEERDPVEPFTLYGTSFKKYLIEQLDGEKIVARKRGFTVDACVGALPNSAETPEFQGLPTGEKARYAGNRTCSKAEGADLKDTCSSACSGACSATVSSYAAEIVERSGLRLLAKDEERLLKSCVRNCAYECSKPGKAYDFVVPFRKGS